MNIAENLLIKYQMLLNSLCLGMEFFFEMVTKNVEELPHNRKGWIEEIQPFFVHTQAFDSIDGKITKIHLLPLIFKLSRRIDKYTNSGHLPYKQGVAGSNRGGRRTTSS